MTVKIHGLLEIDSDRGVVYFHSDTDGTTKLRISELPRPVLQSFGPGAMIAINLHYDPVTYLPEQKSGRGEK